MGMPRSEEGFPDSRLFMDRAVAAERGARAIFRTSRAANSFRIRCYSCRAREVKRNRKVYSEDNTAYNKSVWDKLIFFIERPEDRGDGLWALVALHDGDEALKMLHATIEDV